MTRVRLANTKEAGWVNARYAEVGFSASDLESEVVAVAELGGSRAGLGRLVPVTRTVTELGGILVFDEFRGRGIATEIVRFLVERCRPRTRLFCIPFTHLCPFYERFGFERVGSHATSPRLLLEKLEWCRGRYEAETCLMERK